MEERFNFINEPTADSSEEGAVPRLTQEEIRAQKRGSFLRGSASRPSRTAHGIGPIRMADDLLERAREKVDEARKRGE